jgi:hypothetical protein
MLKQDGRDTRRANETIKGNTIVRKLTLEKLFEMIKTLTNELRNRTSANRVISRKRTRAFIAIVTLMLLSGFMFIEVMSAVQTSLTIANSGTISTVGVGAYYDSACTNRISSIDWGLIAPGGQKSVSVYIRNEGSTAITLAQSTSNWNPSTASSYLSLSWSYNGQTINPNASLQVTLTLNVSPSVNGVTGYSFDIIIAGSG